MSDYERQFEGGELGPWDPEMDDVDAHLERLRLQRSAEAGNDALHLSRMPRPKTPEELRAVLPMMTARVEKAFPQALARVALEYPDEVSVIDQGDLLDQIIDVPLDTYRLRANRAELKDFSIKDGSVLIGTPTYILEAYAPESAEYDKPFLDQNLIFHQGDNGVSGKWFGMKLPGLKDGRLHPRHRVFTSEYISDHLNAALLGTDTYYPLAIDGDRMLDKACFNQPMLPLPHKRDRELLDSEGPQAVYFEHLRIAVLGLEAAARQGVR